MASPSVQQTVTGDHNIFTATGDINVTYNLPPAEAADHHNLNILLDRVNAFWVDGVLGHSLASEMAHDLAKDRVVDAVEHPWESVLELPGQAARVLERTDPVRSTYDKVGRSMLILGEPGSGKTVTLLELARDLVNAARTDPSQPVPVVLNLSSWAGQSLERWLVDELKSKYFVAERMGRPLLEKNRLALLLDGLDEVAMGRQAACVEAINAFTGSVGVPGLAVCSRLSEYTTLPVRLKLHGAIRLDALTREQVVAYLTSMGDGLESLRTTLMEDEALASLAQSPLMLSVMSIAYRDKDIEQPSEHGETLVESRRAQIFDAYIEQMFARKGTGTARGERRENEAWLANLARRMRENNQSVLMIEALQPSWLPDAGQRLVYALQSRLAACVALGLIEGLYLGYSGIVGDSFVADLTRGVLLGILFGLGAGVFDWLRMEHSMKSGNKARKASIHTSILSLLVYFLVFVAAFLLLWGMQGAVRLVFGLLWALLFAMRARAPAARTDIRAVEKLAWSWRRALKGSLAGFAVGLLFDAALIAVLGYDTYAANPALFAYPVLLPIGYALVGALIAGLATVTLEARTTPNQGMRLSRRNARFGGLLVGCVIGALAPIYMVAPSLIDPAAALPATYVVVMSALMGAYFGILAALWFGGLDVIYHRTLCRHLARAGLLPGRLEAFLEQMSKITLLQRVGGGYIFLHRLLLEHFADRRESPEPGI